MSSQSSSGTSGQGSGTQQGDKPKTTQVTLTFDRHLTDDEVKQMQMQHKAVSVIRAAADGHHDHDHPSLS